VRAEAWSDLRDPKSRQARQDLHYGLPFFKSSLKDDTKGSVTMTPKLTRMVIADEHQVMIAGDRAQIEQSEINRHPAPKGFTSPAARKDP
jgi:hypothetical protein